METLRLAFSAKLEKLIAKFEADREHYLSKAYPEAQARVDFITPFFKALGWDVENEAGLPHHQREVIVEKGEAETEGRPDYSFRLAGQTKFFVEAKAPSEPLDSAKHILQAKGYAWNTKQVFFVILTDFEEFRFYDASIKPDERNPDEGLLLTLKYTDYLTKRRKALGILEGASRRGLARRHAPARPAHAAAAHPGGRSLPGRDDGLARRPGAQRFQEQPRPHRQAIERSRAAPARPHRFHPHR